MGRFTADTAGPVFEWPGSALLANFTGTGISVTLQELIPAPYTSSSPSGNVYSVVLDGNLLVPNLAARSGTTSYQLATGLAYGFHAVRLSKATEARVGGVRFLGFTVEGGDLTQGSRPVSRRLAIIGDSISNGYGVTGKDANCPYSPGTQDATRSYGALAAARVGADVVITAWSGKGLWRNSDGRADGTMPQLYQRTLPSDYTSGWDPNSYTPDAIVINLGTNDFANGVPPADSFKGAYSALIGILRQSYPAASILCALGPMLSDSTPLGQMQLSTARSYIHAVVNTSNDPNVLFIEFPSIDPSQEGCDGHPNSDAQQAMGAQLSSVLHGVLNW
jgi:lysophospholipase L1-like esterase